MGKINKELEAVESYSGGVGFDKHSACPFFYDFEDDLHLRVTRLKDAHKKLSSACQEIESEKRALFSALVPRRTLMLGGVWLAKNAALGLVTFGTAVLGFGLTNVSPHCRKVLYWIQVPSWVVFLICFAVGYKALWRKHLSLESELTRGKQTVSTGVTNICSHVGISIAEVVMKSALVSQVKLSTGIFFSKWQQRDLQELENRRDELQQVMNNLK